MPKIAAVRDGDRTTTGGRVYASGSNINDKGRNVALDGNEASCGTCGDLFKILGTGRSVLDGNRHIAVDNDEVLCPCNKNRLIAGGNPGLWLERDRIDRVEVDATTTQQRDAHRAPLVTFDEQVRAGGASDGYPYLIEMADGRTITGRIESGGALPRMMTGENADEYTVYWGDDALVRSNQI